MNRLIIKKHVDNFTLEAEKALIIELRAKGGLHTILKEIIKYYDKEIEVGYDGSFEVKSIMRHDLHQFIGKEIADIIPASSMKNIARKMSDIIQDDYWVALETALESLGFLGSKKKER